MPKAHASMSRFVASVAIAYHTCIVSAVTLPDIAIAWGVRPTNADANWTSLYTTDTGTESLWMAQDFTNRWTVGLLGIGEGGWTDERGWDTPTWISSRPDSIRARPRTGEVFVEGMATLPLTVFGLWETDPTGQAAGADMLTWYTNQWSGQKAVNFLIDKSTGKAYIFSSVPGGTSPIGLRALSIDELYIPELYSGTYPPREYNNANVFVKDSAGKAYRGAQVPPWCIWLADCELTNDELSQWPDYIVQFAFRERIRPDDPTLKHRFDSTLFIMR